MTFRDDRDALLDRAEAAERALHDAERDRDEARGRAEALAREVEELRRGAGRSPEEGAAEPRTVREARRLRRAILLALALVLPVAIFFTTAVVALVRMGHEKILACTIDSKPRGAEVVGVRLNLDGVFEQQRLGITPLTLPRLRWPIDGLTPPYLELRLVGHEPYRVPPPVDADGCFDRTVELPSIA